MAKKVNNAHHHAPAHVPDAHKNVTDKPQQHDEALKPYEKGFKPLTALEARVKKTIESLRLNNLLTPVGINQAKCDIIAAVENKTLICDLVGKALEEFIVGLINAEINK